MHGIGYVAVRAALGGITAYGLSQNENDLATVSENKAKAIAINMLIYGVAKIIFSSLPSGPLGFIIGAVVALGVVSLWTPRTQLDMKFSEYLGYHTAAFCISRFALKNLLGI